MSGSRICWLLPLALALFLGLPAQGDEVFQSRPGSRRFMSKEEARELWEQHQNIIISHAAKARNVALKYWSEKYNTRFSVAPGEMSHILMETVYGRIYHVVMKLVKVDCPEDKSETPQVCKIQPGSPMLTCKLAVIVFFQHDKAYISEEGCQEGQYTPTPPDGPEKQHFPPPPKEREEEPYPFV